MADVEVPVLIAGGGPVGLAASICLSAHGVRSLLVEQHATTTTHPKATVVNARTYEIFRQWGIEDEARRRGLPPERSRFIVWATTLTGWELGRLDLAPGAGDGAAGVDPERVGAGLGRHSPSVTGICPQDVYEPILRRRAEAEPTADVRFGTRLVSFEQDAGGVRALLAGEGDAETRVRARYLLACDGAASSVRERLGIAMLGPDDIGNLLNVYFHADLGPFVRGREGALYWIVNPETPGVFIALDNERRWLFNTPFRLAAGESLADFTPERCTAIVRRAVGDASLPVEVRAIDPWVMRSQVAERYREARVFLVGDAAHRFPPTGGFGMNTGVQDAHNLAWKLAGVLRGWADEALLDTYEPERRPVGQFNADQSLKNSRQMPTPLRPGEREGNPLGPIEDDTPEGQALRDAIASGIGRTREHFSAQGQAKGFAYESAAIVPDGTRAGGARSTVERYVPTARPGSLAPHLWVRGPAGPRSLLDLFGTRFVLLAGPGGHGWRAAAGSVTGVPLDVRLVGSDVVPEGATAADWCALYGVEPDGAVLVRPDGHVAFRATSGGSGAAARLADACARATGRTGEPSRQAATAAPRA